MELPAAAFDDALVTDVYKPRMHQVLLALSSGACAWPLVQPPQPLQLHWRPMWLCTLHRSVRMQSGNLR
jgi:hypothetical protein